MEIRTQTLQVGGWRPVRANQMAKNSPASPRVVRRGTARPAENRFAWPPWRPNTEILPQSAGADNPESCFGAYRGTRTIAIPPCRRSFFYHRTHGIRLRRTQKEVGKRCRPDASTTTLSQGTRSVASARLPTYPFLTQKWYRPGARCTRAALGAWRPNAGGRNVLRPTRRQAHPQHEEYPNLRPVNTERAEVRRHGGFLELACAHLNHAACNLHGLVAKPRLRQAQPSRIFAKQHRFSDFREGRARRGRNRDGFASASFVSPEGRFCVFCGKKLPSLSGLHVGETARKPVSEPLSVPPCLRPLRVNRPEASRTPRAEGGAGTSRARPSTSD